MHTARNVFSLLTSNARKLAAVGVSIALTAAATNVAAVSCWRTYTGALVTTQTPTPPYGAVASVPCPFATTPAPAPRPPSNYEREQYRYQRPRAEGGMCSPNPVVYSCRRELGADTATTTRNRGYGVLNHSYLCVSTSSGIVCGGQTSDNLYGTGSNDNISVYRPSLCSAVSRDSAVARCVLGRLADPNRPQYGVVGPGTNCQEFAKETLASCR